MKSSKISKQDWVSYISIIVIVVSLASIGMNLTGYATVTDTAVVNVTIDTSAAINFTTAFVDFGNGTVNGGESGANLSTENSVTGGSWSPISSGLVLENIGNTNVSIAFKSDKNADTYIGGTNPTFKYKITETESGSCAGNTASGYIEINTTDFTVCPIFPYSDSNDEISIDIELYIPSDSLVGEQTATITATGTYS